MRFKTHVHTQWVDDELLLYDSLESKVHCLKGELAKAAQGIEQGEKPAKELRDDLVSLGVIEVDSATSRRKFLEGSVKAASLGLVVTAALPVPAQAASITCTAGDCTNCCAGVPSMVCMEAVCTNAGGTFQQPIGVYQCLEDADAAANQNCATALAERVPDGGLCSAVSGATHIFFCCNPTQFP